MYFYKVMVEGCFGIRCYDYIKSKKPITTFNEIINATINRIDLPHQDYLFFDYLRYVKYTRLWVEKISFFKYCKYIFFEM